MPSSIRHEAAELIQKHAKALNNEITVDELKIVEDLAVTPEVKKNGIGSFTAARMKIVGGLDGRERRLPEGEGAEAAGRLRDRLPAGEADHALTESGGRNIEA